MGRHFTVLIGSPPNARKVSQILRAGGMDIHTAEESKELMQMLKAGHIPTMVYVHGSMLVETLIAVRGFEQVRVFPFVDQNDAEIFAASSASEQVGGVIGIRTSEGPPRPWELLSIARRLTSECVPPINAPLSWGHSWQEHSLRTTQDRHTMVESIQQYCSQVQTTRQAATTAQVADELIMNAMYDAPVDKDGKPLYAHRRNETIELEPNERPTLGFGYDGAHIVLSIMDPFGHLPRDAVFRGIHRGLTTGQMDTRGGGAGLGMLLMHRAAKVLFFDVIPGRRTQVTAVIELGVSMQEQNKVPGSVYFFKHEGRARRRSSN